MTDIKLPKKASVALLPAKLEATQLFNVLAEGFTKQDSQPAQAQLTDYMAELDGLSLSETQKHELIATVWVMIDTLLRLEFGYHPTQQILENKQN